MHAQVLATKRDLAELETRLVREIGEQAARITEVEAKLAETTARIGAETQARIAETKADLVKWMLGALTAQTLLLLGAIRLF